MDRWVDISGYRWVGMGSIGGNVGGGIGGLGSVGSQGMHHNRIARRIQSE